MSRNSSRFHPTSRTEAFHPVLKKCFLNLNKCSWQGIIPESERSLVSPSRFVHNIMKLWCRVRSWISSGFMLSMWHQFPEKLSWVERVICNLLVCFSLPQKNSVEAISLLVQDYHSRSAIRELNGKWSLLNHDILKYFNKQYFPLAYSRLLFKDDLFISIVDDLLQWPD